MEQTGEPYYIGIEIENRQCKGLRMLKNSGVSKYAIMDIRGAPKGSTRHLIRIPRESIRKLPGRIFEKTPKDEAREMTSAWFDTNGCEACNTILAHSSFLVSARHIEGYSIIYNFITPSFDEYKEIISAFEGHGIRFKISEVSKFNPIGKILTEKQERVLWLALRMGFFDFPRKVTMKELANRLGVGLSTLSEIIRRGTRRLLEGHFET